eukprot:878457-Pleurochrysis_carterae.AAC.1
MSSSSSLSLSATALPRVLGTKLDFGALFSSALRSTTSLAGSPASESSSGIARRVGMLFAPARSPAADARFAAGAVAGV